MHACNTAYYGQTEAMVALPMAASRIRSEESVKQLGEDLGVDGVAVVGDTDQHTVLINSSQVDLDD